MQKQKKNRSQQSGLRKKFVIKMKLIRQNVVSLSEGTDGLDVFGVEDFPGVFHSAFCVGFCIQGGPTFCTQNNRICA